MCLNPHTVRAYNRTPMQSYNFHLLYLMRFFFYQETRTKRTCTKRHVQDRGVTTNCSPRRFKLLIDKLNERQLQAVNEVGFGGLLFIRCKKLHRPLLNWLVEQFDERRHSFRIGECELHITDRDVSLILGLRTDGEPITLDPCEILSTDLRRAFNCSGDLINLDTLDKIMVGGSYGNEFKQAFILYSLGVILCPGARPNARAIYLQHLQDISQASRMSWGRHVIDTLVESLSTYRRNERKYLGGCMLLLQVCNSNNIYFTLLSHKFIQLFGCYALKS